MAKMTKKGALQVTRDLDRIASLFQAEHAALGVPKHIAHDFALRCDMISDAVERTAGLSREALTGYDPVNEPKEIGEEVAGPLVDEPDEPYMSGEFTQQENRELRERQQKSEMGPDKVTTEPQKPTSGVQASFKGLITALKSGEYDEARVARALRLATGVVKQGKGKVPPEFLEQQKGKKKDDDEGDEKEAKKAHGYNLFA